MSYSWYLVLVFGPFQLPIFVLSCLLHATLSFPYGDNNSPKFHQREREQREKPPPSRLASLSAYPRLKKREEKKNNQPTNFHPYLLFLVGGLSRDFLAMDVVCSGGGFFGPPPLSSPPSLLFTSLLALSCKRCHVFPFPPSLPHNPPLQKNAQSFLALKCYI